MSQFKKGTRTTRTSGPGSDFALNPQFDSWRTVSSVELVALLVFAYALISSVGCCIVGSTVDYEVRNRRMAMTIKKRSKIPASKPTGP